MEIKLELFTKKATKATVAIATAYGLCCVSERANDNNLSIANTIVINIVITILYSLHLTQK